MVILFSFGMTKLLIKYNWIYGLELLKDYSLLFSGGSKPLHRKTDRLRTAILKSKVIQSLNNINWKNLL